MYRVVSVYVAFTFVFPCDFCVGCFEYRGSSLLEGFALEFGILVVSSGLVLVIVVVFGFISVYLYLPGTFPFARFVEIVIVALERGYCFILVMFWRHVVLFF